MPANLEPAWIREPEARMLGALHQQARRTADRLGAPVLLAYAFDLAGAEPLAMLRRAGISGAFRFFWEKPRERFALAGALSGL